MSNNGAGSEVQADMPLIRDHPVLTSPTLPACMVLAMSCPAAGDALERLRNVFHASDLPLPRALLSRPPIDCVVDCPQTGRKTPRSEPVRRGTGWPRPLRS